VLDPIPSFMLCSLEFNVLNVVNPRQHCRTHTLILNPEDSLRSDPSFSTFPTANCFPIAEMI
jgi:hypothetical protein